MFYSKLSFCSDYGSLLLPFMVNEIPTQDWSHVYGIIGKTSPGRKLLKKGQFRC
jgi:hypothetical protein